MWVNISEHIPKGQRYTIGTRIESKFLNLLELSYTAYFTEKEKKQVKVQDCIHATDVLKFLIHVAWEAKFISHKQYAEIIPKLEAIGKMFGGWKKNIDQGEKKNRNQ